MTAPWGYSHLWDHLFDFFHVLVRHFFPPSLFLLSPVCEWMDGCGIGIGDGATEEAKIGTTTDGYDGHP